MTNKSRWAWAKGGLKAVFVAIVPGALVAYVAWRVLRRFVGRRTATGAAGL